jgi:hypothetical protein
MAIDSTELSIINKALTNLGVRRVTWAQVQTPDNKASRLADETYENIRNELLQDHPWNFATFRAEILLKDSYVPEYDYNFAFDIPDGTTPAGKPACLRVLEIDENPLWEWRPSGWYMYNEDRGPKRWKLEHGQILTNHDEPISLRYIGIVSVVTDMTPMFTDLLAAMVSVEWAESLTSAEGLSDRLEARFRSKLVEARTIDGQEGIPDPVETSYWIAGRGV